MFTYMYCIVCLMQDVADLDHSRFDCLMVSVLTHGVNGKLYSTDGELISVEEITSCVDLAF